MIGRIASEQFQSALFGAGICMLAACSPITEQIEQASEDVREILNEHLNETDARSRPLIQNHETPYINPRRVAYEGVAWLHEWVDMRAADLPMNMVLAKAMEQLPNPPSVVFTEDLTRPDLPVTLIHEGPFRDFLNRLAVASGYSWEQEGGTLYWMAEITRTYNVHRVPGDFSFSMETQEESDSALQGGGGGDEIDALSDTGGEISLEGGGTFWDDLEETLETLLPTGSTTESTIDRSTGTVVVRGWPTRCAGSATISPCSTSGWTARCFWKSRWCR